MSELNTALILPVITPMSLEFGGMSAGVDDILFENGISDYLPNFETQSMVYGDTWGCVSHSMESAFQILIIRRFDSFLKENQDWLKESIYNNGYPDFSDRDLVVLSGTKPREGNSGEKVLATAQDKGLVSQKEGNWDTSSRNPENTIENYYLYSRSEAGQKIADEWNKRFEIIGEWVQRPNFEKASKRGVLQVYVNAWYKNEEGKYYNPTGGHNHAVVMVNHSEVSILDTYQPSIKQLTSWDDAYYWALKINIKEKSMDKPKIEDNTLVQLVTRIGEERKPGDGQFGLFLDNTIRVGNSGDVLASVFMRSSVTKDGSIIIKKKPLNRDEWALFEKKPL